MTKKNPQDWLIEIFQKINFISQTLIVGLDRGAGQEGRCRPRTSWILIQILDYRMLGAPPNVRCWGGWHNGHWFNLGDKKKCGKSLRSSFWPRGPHPLATRLEGSCSVKLGSTLQLRLIQSCYSQTKLQNKHVLTSLSLYGIFIFDRFLSWILLAFIYDI